MKILDMLLHTPTVVFRVNPTDAWNDVSDEELADIKALWSKYLTGRIDLPVEYVWSGPTTKCNLVLPPEVRANSFLQIITEQSE